MFKRCCSLMVSALSVKQKVAGSRFTPLQQTGIWSVWELNGSRRGLGSALKIVSHLQFTGSLTNRLCDYFP